jgi:hypothetical protein
VARCPRPSSRWRVTPGFGDGDVALHGIVEGTVAEIQAIETCLDAEVNRYGERHPT